MAEEAGGDTRPELRVRLGDTVIIDINGEKQLFMTVKPRSKAKLGGSEVSLEPIVGCLYGSIFTLSADGEELVPVEHTPSPEWASAAPEVSRNNANLQDLGTINQQLTKEDIDAMRAAGKGGDEIVAALAASSATFATKTEFSQEKYKKKKAKKYIFNAVIRRPTAATVCQAYYAKQPARIGHLRLDALSLLLSLANVGAHARVLVLDACGGIVTAAVAERLGGLGSVTAAHMGNRSPGTEALRQFNFAPAVRGSIRAAPLAVLAAEAAAAQQGQQAQQAGQGATAELQDAQAAGGGGAAAALEAAAAGEAPPATTAGAAGAGEQGGEGMQVDPPQQQPQPSAGAAPAAPAPWAPYTSCIVAAPALSPSAALGAVLPLLAPSAAFAVWCPWQQPLAEAMAEVQASRRAVGLTLQECWWRDHQVLPARTHPTMSMDHGGGYLLSGTAVVGGGDGPAGSRASGGGGGSSGDGRQSGGRKRKA